MKAALAENGKMVWKDVPDPIVRKKRRIGQNIRDSAQQGRFIAKKRRISFAGRLAGMAGTGTGGHGGRNGTNSAGKEWFAYRR